MTTKELIRAEIRKWQSNIEARCPESTMSRDYTKEEWDAIYEYNAYTRLLSFLDTLPDEPEQPTMGYDEAYLNEKIAKASKSWKGVDVDKFMDEIRGREPVTDCHDLTEAAEKSARQYYVDGGYSPFPNTEMASHIAGFKAGAEWMKTKMMDEWLKDREGCFWDGVNEGKKAMEEQMMEGATYNELMELYMAIRDEIIKRHRDAAVNIKEKTMDLKEDTGNESALHQIRG